MNGMMMKVKFSKYAVGSAIDRLEGIEDYDFEMFINKFNCNVHECEAILQKLLEKDILMKMGPEVEAEVELSEKEVTLLFNLVL